MLAVDYEEGAEGACAACGVRPARGGDTDRRCLACHAEHEIGRDLPRLEQCVWLDGGGGDDEPFAPFGAFRLRLGLHIEPGSNVISAWRLRGSGAAWPLADRWLANHVPTFAPDEWQQVRYRDIPQIEAKPAPTAGDIKTMAHIAADAREPSGDGWQGRAMLAVLKADVDNLGRVFGEGLGARRSIGRLVALSRAIDAFFTGWLPDHLRRAAPETYTVYAGGDDLLLIGPWRQTISLAGELRAAWGRYVGGDPRPHALGRNRAGRCAGAAQPLGASQRGGSRRKRSVPRARTGSRCWTRCWPGTRCPGSSIGRIG